MTTIKVEGLEPILRRFTSFQNVAKREIRMTMNDSLNTIHENIPPYPPPPPTSKYKRTYSLGRSVGLNHKPDIKRVIGSGNTITGEFGTRLKYAPYVIGENQAWMHSGRWWRLPVEVVNRAIPKITTLWQQLAEDLARYLDSKGL